MIAIIIKENHDFSILSDEQLAIYRDNFEKLGMKPTEFLHIISAAERKEYQKGEYLIKHNQKNDSLHFVYAGRLSVQLAKEPMYEISNNQVGHKDVPISDEFIL